MALVPAPAQESPGPVRCRFERGDSHGHGMQHTTWRSWHAAHIKAYRTNTSRGMQHIRRQWRTLTVASTVSAISSHQFPCEVLSPITTMPIVTFSCFVCFSLLLLLHWPILVRGPSKIFFASSFFSFT